jgi:glutathione synthase
MDLPITCIDIIGGYLSEVNVTSPSGIPEINQITGQKHEGYIVDYLEMRVVHQ